MTANIREILGLDVGTVRIGVARASTIVKIPEPLRSISTEPAEHAIEQLRKIIAEHKTDAVVVGLPRDMHLRETEQTRWVREWVKNLRTKVLIPFFWQDETATTIYAENHFKDKVNSYQKSDIDSLSACVIVQDFLETPHSKRMPYEEVHV